MLKLDLGSLAVFVKRTMFNTVTEAAENAHDKVWGLNCAEAGSLGTKVGISGFFRKSRDFLGAYLGFLQNYSWQHFQFETNHTNKPLKLISLNYYNKLKIAQVV